jgi:hypothetical protein
MKGESGLTLSIEVEVDDVVAETIQHGFAPQGTLRVWGSHISREVTKNVSERLIFSSQ